MNTTDLDQISLEQALIDFEVANARVMDLTSRLTSMSRELIQTRSELERLRIGAAPISYSVTNFEGYDDVHNRYAQIRASRLVKFASMFSSKLRRCL
ncbi:MULTISPECIES: hypothetical protein [Xanthomonas]|uniref:Uncharacterized protein n=2 Tax=Xanthomonas oryzae pv. oryzae TaxID=64187 RepID=A0A0U4X083_XANOO|nr:hypothetical protein [Xanthomonas oryzae]AJQ84746.1 hypothetical protein AZ54_20890 [Xanthomonas oryzae pv. oryzae PXO86]ALZ73353.1 hypothetical protein APZ20_19585 [Xanthomonas oryzae pv. oryzae]AOS01292.1 hypothetical protein ATY42_03650 [Xanthomonas oryzae pv. oryzae]AOS07979.1 hypothetical protein ATY43_20445 [Xanthomonas oryzae pv. oryzae]AOS12159.1 hypothetical protein ATY44_19745 [Xanthomonas oryzae pv. oryzae]